MLPKITLVALFIGFFSLCSQAQREYGEFNEVAYFDFNEKLRGAYKSALRMRFKESKLVLQTEISRNTYNLMPEYIDDYVDFLEMYINENPYEYEQTKNKKKVRAAKLSTGDNGSPYYLYTQAELYFRWALAESKFGNDDDAAADLKTAFSLAEANLKKFPDFMPTRKTLGMLHILGTDLPANLRNGLTTKPSMKTGMEHIKAVMDYGVKYPNFEFSEETQILYVLLLLQIGTDNPDHWKLVNTSLLDYKTSPMATYCQAAMQIRLGYSSKALLILESQPKGEEYHSLDLLDYLMGLCKLYKMDHANCITYMSSFLKKHTGYFHVKDAQQKIAWAYLLKGDTKNYAYQIGRVAERGNTLLPIDALAQEEATSKQQPRLELLKAHLYYEGGYFDNALKEYTAISEGSLKTNREKIEYYYRLGSTYHKVRQYDNALKYYALAPLVEKNSTHYMACAAMLQLGIIYEYRKDPTKAKECYAACLKFNPTYYKGSLHGQAQGYLDALK